MLTALAVGRGCLTGGAGEFSRRMRGIACEVPKTGSPPYNVKSGRVHLTGNGVPYAINLGIWEGLTMMLGQRDRDIGEKGYKNK